MNGHSSHLHGNQIFKNALVLNQQTLAAFETLHIVNTLIEDTFVAQIVHDGIAISFHTVEKHQLIMSNYFYRFKFQNRGTVHVHLLVLFIYL